MTDPSATSGPEMSPGQGNGISSRGLGAGATPFASLGSETGSLFGPPPCPASLSAEPGSAPGSRTSGTCGRSSSVSSKSAALRSYAESRLRALTAWSGSTLYALTWKTSAMPSGRSISRLHASALLTRGSVCFGWPTPQARDGERGAQAKRNFRPKSPANLDDRVQLVCGWATPKATDGTKGGGSSQHGQDLPTMAGWATPAARDWKDGTFWLDPRARTEGLPLRQVWLAGWGTPTATESGGTPQQQQQRKRRSQEKGHSLGDSVTALALQAQMVSGPTSNGSPAPTASGGRLNAAFSLWLQGLPSDWLMAAPVKTRRGRRS